MPMQNLKNSAQILIRLIPVGLFSLTLSACSSGFVSSSDYSPSVKDSYDAAMRGDTRYYSKEENSNNMSAGSTASLPYIQASTNGNSIANTLDAQFPKLKNPQSIMYIFGHYAGANQLPVAGHFVPFPFYTQIYYALPEEVLMPYNDGQFRSAGSEND